MRIRKVEEKDIAGLSGMMALAFAQERFHQWLFKDEKTCIERGRELFIFMALRYLNNGMFLTDEELTAAVLCVPPKRAKMSFFSEFRHLFSMVKIFRSKIFFMIRLFNQIERLKPREPHLYVEVLGVHPSCQRQGKGTALLRHILEVCDRNRWLAYLESPGHLVSFYKRFGFEVRAILEIPRAGMTIYTMGRPPGK